MRRQGSGLSTRLDRNLKERNRRTLMRDLYSRLSSLVFPKPTKVPVGELLDQATAYVKQLEQRVEEKKRIKNGLLGMGGNENMVTTAVNREEYSRLPNDNIRKRADESVTTPMMDIRATDFNDLEINIVGGSSTTNFMMHEVLRILGEEGAEVIGLSYNDAGDRIFYTIHSKAFSPRIGIEMSRVQDRLRKLVIFNN